VPDLTPAQTKELLRRLADSSDPRRYLIISRMLPGARFASWFSGGGVGEIGIEHPTYDMRETRIGVIAGEFDRKDLPAR
jgi:hypothetical protein